MKTKLMKTSLVLFLFSWAPLIGQVIPLERLQIDDSLVIDFPLAYESWDTLTQKMTIAYLDNLTMMVSKFQAVKHSNSSFEKLLAGYDEFVIGMKNTAKDPIILSEETVTIDSLLGKKIKMSFDLYDETMIGESLIFSLRSTKYTLQFMYLESDADFLPITFDQFIQSTEFIHLKKEDQIEKGMILGFSPREQGRIFGKIIIYIGILLALLYSIRKRRKRRRLAKLKMEL